MAGFFDFIKKPQQKSSANSPDVTQKSTSSQTHVVETTQTTQSSGQQAYSGIGSPPQPQVVNEQTTVTKTSSVPAAVPAAPAVPTSTANEQKKREEIDLMTHLTQRSNRAFLSAQNTARDLKVDFVDSEHLLHGLLTDGQIYNRFVELKIHPQITEEELKKI